MNKTTKILLALFFTASIGHAATIAFPTYNQTAQSIFEVGKSPFNINVTIPLAGATDRVQLPSNEVTACTIQAPAGNTASVYGGGQTVTNGAGANPGIELIPGSSFGSISVSNSNLIYFAADSAGDVIRVFCN